MADILRPAKLIKPRRDGQITIPVAFRKALGLDEEGTMIEATMAEGGLHLRPVRAERDGQGSPWLRELYEYFAPVREEIARDGWNEDEILAAIDAALVESRQARRSKGA